MEDFIDIEMEGGIAEEDLSHDALLRGAAIWATILPILLMLGWILE